MTINETLKGVNAPTYPRTKKRVQTWRLGYGSEYQAFATRAEAIAELAARGVTDSYEVRRSLHMEVTTLREWDYWTPEERTAAQGRRARHEALLARLRAEAPGGLVVSHGSGLEAIEIGHRYDEGKYVTTDMTVNSAGVQFNRTAFSTQAYLDTIKQRLDFGWQVYQALIAFQQQEGDTPAI